MHTQDYTYHNGSANQPEQLHGFVSNTTGFQYTPKEAGNKFYNAFPAPQKTTHSAVCETYVIEA